MVLPSDQFNLVFLLLFIYFDFFPCAHLPRSHLSSSSPCRTCHHCPLMHFVQHRCNGASRQQVLRSWQNVWVQAAIVHDFNHYLVKNRCYYCFNNTNRMSSHHSTNLIQHLKPHIFALCPILLWGNCKSCGVLLDMEVYRANVCRLVSSLPRVSSTLEQKMCSQAYSFKSLIPRNNSLVFFSRSLEYSWVPSYKLYISYTFKVSWALCELNNWQAYHLALLHKYHLYLKKICVWPKVIHTLNKVAHQCAFLCIW